MPKMANGSSAGSVLGYAVDAEDTTLFNPTSSSTNSSGTASTTIKPRVRGKSRLDKYTCNDDHFHRDQEQRKLTRNHSMEHDSGESNSHCSAMIYRDIRTSDSASSNETQKLVRQHLVAPATACGAMLVGFRGQAMESAAAIATAAVETSEFPLSSRQETQAAPPVIKQLPSTEAKANETGPTIISQAAKVEQHSSTFHETNNTRGKNEHSNEVPEPVPVPVTVPVRSQLICDRYGFIIGETFANPEYENTTITSSKAESARNNSKSKIDTRSSSPTIPENKISDDEDALHEQVSFPDEATIGTTLTAATAAAKSWFGVSSPPEYQHVQQASAPMMLEGSPAESLRIKERQGAKLSASEKEFRMKKEQKRTLKWKSMIKHWNRYFDSHNRLCSRKLQSRIRKGIPHDCRGQVWPLLVDVQSKLRSKPNTYKDLVWSTEIPSQEIRDTIERDIHRTFPRHILFFEDDEEFMNASGNGRASGRKVKAARVSPNGGGTWEQFESYTKDFVKTQIFACGNDDAILQEEMKKTAAARDGMTSTDANGIQHADRDLLSLKGGQASLRRVLRAYSLYDSDTGYCQGMNFVAATFITLMSEEEAFWLLVAIMNEKPAFLRGLYGENMDQTVEILYISECLVGDILPDLKGHFTKEGVALNMFATQWMVTVFTSSFPFSFVLRVWDVLLIEGYKIVYRVMLALLKVSKEKLMKMHLEQILNYLKALPGTVDDVSIMKEAFAISLSRQKIKKYEKQWKRMGRSEA